LALLALSRASAVPPTLTGSGGAGKKVEDKEEEEALVTALAGRPGQSLAPQAWSTGGLGMLTPPRRPSSTLFFARFVDHPECFTTRLLFREGKDEITTVCIVFF